MDIYGFQKLTLLDYPGELACTIFTGGCNFRCPYCHNASLVLHYSQMPAKKESEIFSILNKRKHILKGLCISGGEPTLQPGLQGFIQKVKELGYLVKLDTNGSNPDLLLLLIREKLIDYVAMDIKNSLPSYPPTIGLNTFDPAAITKSTEILLEKQIPYEFRTTLSAELHTKKDMESIATWLKDADCYYLQPYQDTEDTICSHFHAPEKNTLLEYQAILQSTIKHVFIRAES